MTLEEILQDIHGLDAKLRDLEQTYSLLSDDMYTLYRLGELEQSRDLIRWVGQRAYPASSYQKHIAQTQPRRDANVCVPPCISLYFLS